MKKLILVFAVVLMSLPLFCQVNGDTIIANNPANLKLKVMYFHITNRCHTCHSIETNVRKTMADYFQTQLDSGVINLQIYNCELPENEEIVKKYSAYGATFALTTVVDGKETELEDLTNWAFQKIGKPEIFIAELKEMVLKKIN